MKSSHPRFANHLIAIRTASVIGVAIGVAACGGDDARDTSLEGSDHDGARTDPSRPTQSSDPDAGTTQPERGETDEEAGPVDSGASIPSATPAPRPAAPSEPDPAQQPSPATDDGCGLERAAFCETFESAHPGGRGGDLDEARWSFARWGHATWMFQRPGAWSQRPLPTFDVQRNTPLFCGERFENVRIGEDARICMGTDAAGNPSGQFQELFDDAGDFGINSMMIRQPFDFADGGVIRFEVDAKRNDHWDGHGWWIELWLTEDPSPIPYHGAPTVQSYPRNGVGIQFVPIGPECPFPRGTCNQVGTIFVTENYEIRTERPGGGAFNVADGVLNRFEVSVSTDAIVIHASDAGSDELHLVHRFDGLDLSFTRGYVHLQHSQYNAFKDARPAFDDGVWASPAQVYRWDNIAFNGPKLPPLRAYDVSDANLRTTLPEYFPETDLVQYGYDLGEGQTVVLRVDDVDLADAERALFNFNLMAGGGQRLRYRVNGGDWSAYTVPEQLDEYALIRSLAIEIPVTDLMSGTNRIELQLLDLLHAWESMGNADLSLEIAP